jgi:hypothetical protein
MLGGAALGQSQERSVQRTDWAEQLNRDHHQHFVQRLLAARSLAYVTVNKYRCDLGDLMQASVLRFTAPGLMSSFGLSLAGQRLDGRLRTG